jgi:hypothetical protein
VTDEDQLPKIPDELQSEVDHKIIVAAFEAIDELDSADVDLPHAKIVAALVKATSAAQQVADREEAALKGRYRWLWFDCSIAVCVAYTAWLMGDTNVDGWSMSSHKPYKLASFVAFARACEALSDIEAALEDGDEISLSNADFVGKLMAIGFAKGRG